MRPKDRVIWGAAASAGALIAGAAAASPAGAADVQAQQSEQLATGYQDYWTMQDYSNNCPSTGFSLHHLYFNIDQQGTNNNNFTPGGPNPAVEEVGDNVGALMHSTSKCHQFYWATCEDPANPTLCNVSTGYFEGPMSPAPALVVGHSYGFKALNQQHSDGTWWWDLLIKDQSAGGNWTRGGGRTGGSSSLCCSYAMNWGAESNNFSVGSPQDTVGFEQYFVNNAWNSLHGSALYPPGGHGPDQIDDAVWDDSLGFFTHTWGSKYVSIKIGS